MGGRLAAAKAAGLTTVFCAGDPGSGLDGLQVVAVGHVADAWSGPDSRAAPGPNGTGLPKPSEQAKHLEMGL
jgi:hypothetical protein